jgi:hypothetical protein
MGFSTDTKLTCFNEGEKHCLRRTALNTFVRKVITCLGRCLRTLFSIPFGPGALPTMIPLTACRTPEGLVSVGAVESVC